jgi:hypothetical protein
MTSEQNGTSQNGGVISGESGVGWTSPAEHAVKGCPLHDVHASQRAKHDCCTRSTRTDLGSTPKTSVKLALAEQWPVPYWIRCTEIGANLR